MIFDTIQENRERFLSGKFNCIPFNLERFNAYAPGIIRGNFDSVTANSSVGKTTLVKWLYVFGAIEFAIRQNIDLKIIYFALEESEEQFEYSLLSYLMYNDHKLRYNISDFEAFNNVLPDKDMQKLEALKEKYNLYRSYIDLVDSVYNSYGLYKHVRNFARSRGKFYMNDKELTDYELSQSASWNNYVPNNPEEFVIVITDHVSEMHTSKEDLTLFDAIASWTKYQRHYICKRFNYNCCAVQQQMSSQESLDNFKLNKLKPTLQGLADNKLTGRAYLNVYGLFSPDRHEIKNYKDYETNPYFRTICVLKQRYGHIGAELPVFFDGKTGYIRTMPSTVDKKELEKIYNYIKTLK